MVRQTNFEMFSDAGNYACRRLVSRMITKAGALDTAEKIAKFVNDGMDEIEKKHEEVYDTEPRNHIHSYADKVAALHGIDYWDV